MSGDSFYLTFKVNRADERAEIMKISPKAKQVGFIVGVSLLGTLVLNTLARRFAPAAAARSFVNNGL